MSPRGKLHAPARNAPAKPLCGRQLSAAGSRPEAHLAVQGTGGMTVAAPGQPITCRHCLRALGLLPALTTSIQVMSDDELLEAHEEEEY